MYAVTGASGHLGGLVVSALLAKIPSSQVVACVRSPAKAAPLAAKGVVVRTADYDRPETLGPALAGVAKLVFISGSEVGKRMAQHKAVIDAAKAAGVTLIAYTSILHADRSPVGLAEEHRQTEAALRASGVPHALLRNSWYTENYTQAIPTALQMGVILGAAGQGRISAATRRDYAEACAAVLTAAESQAGRVYELAGDDAFTMADYAAELSRQTGKTIAYRDMPEADYKAALLGAGLPDGLAAMLARADTAIAGGALYDGGRQLSGLIGRPTTPLASAIGDALAG